MDILGGLSQDLPGRKQIKPRSLNGELADSFFASEAHLCTY